MFNNITEPNQIVVIDAINHFNQDDICQLSVKPWCWWVQRLNGTGVFHSIFDRSNKVFLVFNCTCIVRACLRVGGGPQVGEVTCVGGVIK